MLLVAFRDQGPRTELSSDLGCRKGEVLSGRGSHKWCAISTRGCCNEGTRRELEADSSSCTGVSLVTRPICRHRKGRSRLVEGGVKRKELFFLRVGKLWIVNPHTEVFGGRKKRPTNRGEKVLPPMRELEILLLLNALGRGYGPSIRKTSRAEQYHQSADLLPSSGRDPATQTQSPVTWVQKGFVCKGQNIGRI